MKKIVYYIVFLLILSSCTKESNFEIHNPEYKVGVVENEIYSFVKIGNQYWSTTNLNVSKYRNGDTIPMISNPTEWANTKNGAWCYYNNDPATERKQGKLYNWYALIDSRGLLPHGYRLPDSVDYHELVNSLGGYNKAHIKLTTNTENNWVNLIFNPTNESNWSALPCGVRGVNNEKTNSDFGGFSEVGYWWTLNETDDFDSKMFGISNQVNNCEIWKTDKNNGLSIRFIYLITKENF